MKWVGIVVADPGFKQIAKNIQRIGLAVSYTHLDVYKRQRPHWLDVQPASSLISALNKGKTLLHAGPPMRWQERTGPMKGACVGACLFEGWAKDEAQAQAMLEQGEVNFIPGHHVNAVGPMAVSYTHLDVYKRQNPDRRLHAAFVYLWQRYLPAGGTGSGTHATVLQYPFTRE